MSGSIDATYRIVEWTRRDADRSVGRSHIPNNILGIVRKANMSIAFHEHCMLPVSDVRAYSMRLLRKYNITDAIVLQLCNSGHH